MNKPDILFVIGSLDVGGAERHLCQILPVLARRSWRPQVYCLSHRGHLADGLERAGVPVEANLIGRKADPSILHRATRLVFSAVGLATQIVRRRPYAIHFFLPQAYLVGGLISLLMGPEIRFMSRRSLNFYQRKRPLLAALERFLHRRMTLIFANSGKVLEQLETEGVSAERLRLIYNGIDLQPFEHSGAPDATRRLLGIDPAALVLVVVANLIPYKGHRDLIEALAMVSRQMPESWILLCVGRDDGIGDELRRNAIDHGIADRIRWLGQRADVPAILQAADIGILCSHEEGFSNAVLEGMAAALPMVVTDVGGNAEAVVDQESGYVVPARQPLALGAAILRTALDLRRRSMGQAGRQRVERLFSLPHCVAAYETVFLENIPHRPSAGDS